MQIRPDLDAERAKADTRKIPLDMERAERLRLMDVVLKISAIAQEAFDILEADSVSEADVLLILQLPDWCNRFTRGIEQHALRKKERIDRVRQRTSYMRAGYGHTRGDA